MFKNYLKSVLLSALFFVLFLMNSKVHAQATTITVGGVAPTYTRLALAFNAISAGIYPGAVHVQIKGNTNETFKPTLSQNALVDSVMIYPIAAALIQGNLGDNLVELNGADFVHFDGRINRTGSVSSLTISNLDNTTAANTLSFRNSATKNSVRYLTLKGAGNSVVFFESTTTGQGNSLNLIEKSFIGDGASTPRYGIYSVGGSPVTNHNNKILNNCIYNYHNAFSASAGIYLYDYCSNWEINGNSFYQTATRVSSQANTAIKVVPSTFSFFNKHKIQNNYIGGSTDSCGGPTFPISNFIGIDLRSHSDTLSYITNNKIRNLSLSGGFTGIRTDYGKILVQNNSIGDTLGNSSLNFTGTSQTVYGIVAAMNDTVKIYDNYIGALTASCSITGIYVSTQSGLSKVSVTGNLIGSRTVSNSINVVITGTSSITGIRHEITNGIVNKNTIMNLSATNNGGGNCSITGIYNNSGYTWDNHIGYLKSTTQGSTFAGCTGILTFEAKNNFVHHLDFVSDYYTVVGLQAYTAVNNIISLGFGISSAAQFFGIYGNSGVNAGYFHNTVCLGGVGNSPYMSACLYGGTLLKDNIFYTVRTTTMSSPATNYCVFAAGSAVANCFHASGATNVVAWSAGINYSTWGTGGAYVNPMLSNVGSPLAFSYKPNIILNGTNSYGGFVSSVPSDYFNFTRPNPPTIGAIEKTTCVTVPHTKNVSACAASYSVASQVYTTTGTYNQLVTDPGGCDTLLTLNLQLGPPIPSLSASPSTICAGESATLSAIGASNYTWSAPASPTTSSVIVNPSSTIIYTVAASNSIACTGNYTLQLTVKPIPTVSINSGQICIGDSYTLSPGGAITYTYLNGGPVISPSSTGSYSVIGTGTNGCIAGANAQVTVNALPLISVNSGSLCTGSVYTLAPGGALNYTFSPSGPTVSPVTNATFVITGEDANGCIQTGSATINVLPLPTVAVNGGSVCAGNPFLLQPSGGVSYIYYNGGPTVSPLSTTIYSVSSVDVNGCSSLMGTAQVLAVQLPSVTITPSATLICQGQSFTLNANGADSYTWSTGANTGSVQLNPSVGIYTYTLTGIENATGCKDSTNVTITVDACTVIKNTEEDVFAIYPNPAHDVIKIKSRYEGVLKLYSITGQLLVIRKTETGDTILNIGDYPAGLYIISFETGSFIRNYRVVKE